MMIPGYIVPDKAACSAVVSFEDSIVCFTGPDAAREEAGTSTDQASSRQCLLIPGSHELCIRMFLVFALITK